MISNYQTDLGFLWFPAFLFSLLILLIQTYQGLSADAPPLAASRPAGAGPGIGLINTKNMRILGPYCYKKQFFTLR